jgi:hypothetical protein
MDHDWSCIWEGPWGVAGMLAASTRRWAREGLGVNGAAYNELMVGALMDRTRVARTLSIAVPVRALFSLWRVPVCAFRRTHQVDTQHYIAHMPHTVEAFFVPESSGARDATEAVWRKFLWHFGLTSDAVPLVLFRGDQHAAPWERIAVRADVTVGLRQT